ncbi:uncharacterized protein LOC116121644 [Pistacia vera]|uniref:uncharacterized protein LOC116121644 n=1 Tax=Pistacia vera TaxID=55513 RepID=UPI001263D3D2|nr:uncharacterized protein LOC116121644 [Pistacia vera]
MYKKVPHELDKASDASNDARHEIEKLVAEVVRYVIFKAHQNSGCPIKREELVHLVTKNYSQCNLPAFVINAAKEKLSSVFGYELRELQRSRPASANLGRPSQNSVADPKSYILVSQLPPEVYKKYVEDVNTAHLTGFTFVIVSIVHLAGGKIPEGNFLVWLFSNHNFIHISLVKAKGQDEW